VLDLWVSPSHLRHITVLEVAHTKTPLQIKEYMNGLRSYLEDLLKYPCSHMVRLHRPLLSYDGAGVALTFLPADSDPGFLKPSSQLDKVAICSADCSYHHLRRDMFNLCAETGVIPESRYHNPSAHVTIARFITSVDFSAETSANGDTESLLAVHGPERMKKWIDTIEEINRWLMEEYWPDPSNDLLPNPPPSETDAAGQWIIGKDAILDCRTGNNWYGGGDPGLPELDSLCGRIWRKPMKAEALVQATVAVKIEPRPLPMCQ
jgi:vesicle-fusing ATPase